MLDLLVKFDQGVVDSVILREEVSVLLKDQDRGDPSVVVLADVLKDLRWNADLWLKTEHEFKNLAGKCSDFKQLLRCNLVSQSFQILYN